MSIQYEAKPAMDINMLLVYPPYRPPPPSPPSQLSNSFKKFFIFPLESAGARGRTISRLFDDQFFVDKDDLLSTDKI